MKWQAHAAMLGAMLFTALVSSCSPPVAPSIPSSPPSVGTLVGVWRADYAGKITFDKAVGDFTRRSGYELLRIRGDGTYSQSFHDGASTIYSGPTNSWTIATSASAAPTVSFTHMRFFPDGTNSALAFAPKSEISLLFEESSNIPFRHSDDRSLCFQSRDLNICFQRITTNAEATIAP